MGEQDVLVFTPIILLGLLPLLSRAYATAVHGINFNTKQFKKTNVSYSEHTVR